MRFLVDENLPADIADMLNAMGHETFAIVGSGLEGTDDSRVWQMAYDEDRILVTQDLDFPLNIRPTPPGLVLIRMPGHFDVDVQLELIREFFAKESEESLLGQVTVFAPGQRRNREL